MTQQIEFNAGYAKKLFGLLILSALFLLGTGNPIQAQNDTTNDAWRNYSNTTYTNDKAAVGKQSSPNAQFTVYEEIGGNAGNTLALDGAVDTNPNIMFMAQNSNRANLRYVQNLNRMELLVGNNATDLTRIMVMTKNGVGVGTGTPSSKFQVIGESRLGSSSNYVAVGFGGQNSYIDARGSSGKLVFRRGYADVMSMSGSGLAIGNAALPAGFKLSVDGKVICNELRVKLTQDWPDYVADEDYEVQGPIEQEASFRATGALPGFPTEAELGGAIDLGEITRLQQEKIEELMLICSQQQQMLGEMQASIDTILKR